MQKFENQISFQLYQKISKIFLVINIDSLSLDNIDEQKVILKFWSSDIIC